MTKQLTHIGATFHRKAIFIFLSSLGLISISIAQDIHFSQFNITPMLTNPAATGPVDMDYRISNNYKSQWNSVSIPFSTLAISYDMSIFKNGDNNRFLGVGVAGFTDAAGKSRYGTSQAILNVAGIQRIGQSSFLSAGIMYGYGQRRISLNGLSWDSQYNGEAFDPNLPSEEPAYGYSKSYSDIGAGLMWQTMHMERVTATIGASVLHINKPVNSFNSELKDRISQRYIIHADFDKKLPSQSNKMDSYIHPKIMVSSQGAHYEAILGLFIKNVIQAPSRYTTFRNLSIFEYGLFYRVGDAIVAACGMDYHKLKLGLSYDINISKLQAASTYRGGLEISIIFKGIYNDTRIKL